MLGSKTEPRLPIGILRILTISPFTEMLGTDILARCLGVPSTRTSVLSAFSFSLFCDIHVYMSVRQPSSLAIPMSTACWVMGFIALGGFGIALGGFETVVQGKWSFKTSGR